MTTGANGRSLRSVGRLAGVALVALLLAACSTSQKKLSDDSSVIDGLVHDVLGIDRNPGYYYELVRDSHDPETFRYRPSEDEFLIDKNVDAVQKLGGADFARLEGQAQVVDKLSDVLLEDPSALAQANAANSLTRMGVKLPQYRSRGLEERGDVFLALLQEMDAMHAAGGAMRTNPGWARTRLVQILDTIGRFEMATLILAKSTLKPFFTRDYLIDATDSAVRQAADTALVRRMGEVIRLALRSAVDADEPFVREEAIRGLKTLGDRSAEDAVLARLAVEANWRVRAEAVEYLGRAGGQEGVAVLLPLLDDPDPTLRHKARQALTRLAGRDLGFRRRTWTRWAHARFPELARRAAEAKAEEDEGDEDASLP
jgi:hypothetical protein